MYKGILMYALNNEQIDYTEIAVYAAKQVKKHLNVPIALVTDSFDWLIKQFPDYRKYFDILIKVVHQSDISVFNSTYEYAVGSLVYYENSIWKKVAEGADYLYPYNHQFNLDNFDKIYQGIDIDKWYPDLPYLVGQHVWYENNVYRCEIQYQEGQHFSKDNYALLLENVQDSLKLPDQIIKGDRFLYDRSLWMAKKDIINQIQEIPKATREYVGIDIDKWYPNLPYLVGQHVWYENTLYRCREEYNEGLDFSKEKYDIVLENIKDLSVTKKFSKGDLLLHERSVWSSNIDFDIEIQPINTEVWENTNERQIVFSSSAQYRRYFDGAMTFKRLKFKNDIRIKSFELSPFDETIVIDCDYIINNDILKYCWDHPNDFLIYKKSVDLSGFRYDPRLVTLSDKSVDFYWATVFYFKKNENTKIFFDLLGHIQDNWNYYRYVYQIEHSLYRNDYAFSIAIHMMNGYQTGFWAQELPGTLHYTTDRDILIKHQDTEMTLLIEKEKYKGEYTLMKIHGLNLHVMNKFSIARIIRENVNV